MQCLNKLVKVIQKSECHKDAELITRPLFWILFGYILQSDKISE